MDDDSKLIFEAYLKESITMWIPDAEENAPDETDTILEICHRLISNPVGHRWWEKFSEFEKQHFQQNRPPEVFSPDGNDAFEPNGTLNMYIKGFTDEMLQKVLSEVQPYLDQIDADITGPSAPEQSGMMRSQVMRWVINNNKSAASDIPQVNMSNGNMRKIIRDVLGYEDFDYSGEFKPSELLLRINNLTDANVQSGIREPYDSADEPVDPYEQALRQQQGGSGVGARVINSGLSDSDIRRRLDQVAQLAQWAVDNGYDEIIAN